MEALDECVKISAYPGISKSKWFIFFSLEYQSTKIEEILISYFFFQVSYIPLELWGEREWERWEWEREKWERGRDYFISFYYCLNMSIRFKTLHVVKLIDAIWPPWCKMRWLIEFFTRQLLHLLTYIMNIYMYTTPWEFNSNNVCTIM